MKEKFEKLKSLWLPVISAMLVPGSGYVLLGRPLRGLQMLFFMGFMGFISYKLTGDNISPVGRLAGGFAVWALSVVEVYRLANLQRVKKKLVQDS